MNVMVLLSLVIVAAVSLAALVWVPAQMLRSKGGRMALAAVASAAVLLFLGAGFVTYRYRSAASIESATEIHVTDDLREWNKFREFQSHPPDKGWVLDPRGKLVGYSTAHPTPEEARAQALRSAREKYKALVYSDLIKRDGKRNPKEIEGAVERFLPLKMEKDSYEDVVKLPQSGEEMHRAAVLVDAPESEIKAVAAAVEVKLKDLQAHVLAERRQIGWMLASALFLALTTYLVYSFLNAETKGHLAWPLRLISAGAYLLLCLALFFLRTVFP